MIPLLTADDMRAAERQAIEGWGISSLLLQEHAALGALALIPAGEPIHVLAGPGNNGGDALGLARLARLQGRQVSVWSPLAQTEWRGDAATQARLWQGLGGDISTTSNPAELMRTWRGWVVDGLFGLGTTRPLEGPVLAWAKALNASGLPVLALDLPSGLDPSMAELPGEVVRATRTACFGALKVCHGLLPARECCGEITVIPIPLDRAPQARMHLLERPVLPPRAWNAHKGSFGHVAIRAGSVGMSGAAVLAALGALRVGAGLVTVLTDAEVRAEVAAQVPEAMVQPWRGSLPKEADVLLVGPGGVAQVPEWEGPMVLDASALKEGEGKRWMERPGTAITPHPGEFARLFRLSRPLLMDERLAQARQVAAGRPGVLILKGAQSVIAGGAQEDLWINPTGHPGMATGGSGDLLAGMVAGFRAQGLPMREAAAAAAWFHGAAGDRLPGAGLLPRDLANLLPELLRDPSLESARA
ncbi:bifunctional NAD(P)H-hydrate repair enzyme [Geothrix limicola]|uniref:Bifunctional NAD(P)H-hydrate repair enzyme n=1 Tax=Geothrix limicola TaxID=2927978 RepID=A0ABQ5QC77_9BACT|nr:NAD(P)H-hydrate dehydratase [Geothrix limicola]GLH72427.1 bifunctional NAD(P)H-hydrate repair enzyme [Geothrix limicola]